MERAIQPKQKKLSGSGLGGSERLIPAPELSSATRTPIPKSEALKWVGRAGSAGLGTLAGKALYNLLDDNIENPLISIVASIVAGGVTAATGCYVVENIANSVTNEKERLFQEVLIKQSGVLKRLEEEKSELEKMCGDSLHQNERYKSILHSISKNNEDLREQCSNFLNESGYILIDDKEI